MPRVDLTVTIPEGVWIGDISRAHPETSVRVLSAHTAEGVGVGLAEVTGPETTTVVDALADAPPVASLETLSRHGEARLIEFETTVPLLLRVVEESGVPLSMPFLVREGRAEWELVASHDRLAELGETLDEFGVPFSVDAVGRRPESLLTDRQRRLLRAAVERGYYETPRECSLTDLADDLGIAKSTCSETLHRAEGRILTRFVETLDRPLDD